MKTMESGYRNLRLALRQIGRNPLFASSIIITLGLAVAVNATIFSFVYALLIRPFPFRDPDQLVQIRAVRGGQAGMLSMPEVLDLRNRVPELAEVAAHTSSEGGYNYSGAGQPQEWKTVLTTGNLFSVLGVPLAAGAPWPADADRSRHNEVVLSHGVWVTTFGSRSDVLGSKITLDHAAGYQIDGVAPKYFDYPQGIQIYRSIGGFAPYDRREARNLIAVARMKPGTTVAQLQSSLDNLARQLAVEFPATNDGQTLKAVQFRELYSGDVKPYLLLLSGAVVFVLLIACANIVNLQLSRTLGRAREAGIRVALGAGKRALIAQWLTESLVSGLAGGLVGLLLSAWSVHILRRIIGELLPNWMSVGVDITVFSFTLAISLIAAVAAGIVPAWYLLQRGVGHNLKQEERGSSGDRQANRLRDLVIVAELATAITLLTGAVFLVRSFTQLQDQQKGFSAASISTFRVALGWKRYIDQESTARYYERALRELAQNPGFREVAFASNPPLSGLVTAPVAVHVEGQPLERALHNPYVIRESVSESYFQLLGIRLHTGRLFTEFDNEKSEPVAILSASLAHALWGDGEALGHRIGYGPRSDSTEMNPKPAMRVIGVVSDVQERQLGGAPGFYIYLPYRQNADANQFLMVKTALSLDDFTRTSQRTMWGIDPQQSIFDFATYEQRMLDTVWQLRLSRMLLLLFSGVALVLATIGVYGVMSHGVSQRQREIGIRMALGATPSRIGGLVLRRALWFSLWGVGFGVLGSVVVVRLGKRFLPVQEMDIGSLLAAMALLSLAMFVAAALPAWRASRLTALMVLRDE